MDPKPYGSSYINGSNKYCYKVCSSGSSQMASCSISRASALKLEKSSVEGSAGYGLRRRTLPGLNIITHCLNIRPPLYQMIRSYIKILKLKGRGRIVPLPKHEQWNRTREVGVLIYNVVKDGGEWFSPKLWRRYPHFLASITFTRFWSPPKRPIYRVTGTLYPGVKREGLEAEHWPPFRVEINNAWSYTSAPPSIFLALCLIKDRDNIFIFINWIYEIIWADHSGHAVWDMKCLRSLERWDHGFESHSKHGYLYCVRLFCICVFLCVGSGLAIGWSPVQGVLPTVKID
jgi:hypothetical protein